MGLEKTTFGAVVGIIVFYWRIITLGAFVGIISFNSGVTTYGTVVGIMGFNRKIQTFVGIIGFNIMEVYTINFAFVSIIMDMNFID